MIASYPLDANDGVSEDKYIYWWDAHFESISMSSTLILYHIYWETILRSRGFVKIYACLMLIRLGNEKKSHLSINLKSIGKCGYGFVTGVYFPWPAKCRQSEKIVHLLISSRTKCREKGLRPSTWGQK